MEEVNPYKRTFKTKREEYQEKLMQKNANQEWIFGNVFGKQGGGAPLRDNQGNIISSLKTITNNNIHSYQAKEFSKGDNNISVINNKIYNQNKILSSTPYHPSNTLDNYSKNQSNKYLNNLNLSSKNEYNNTENQKISSLNNINNNNIIPNFVLIPYANILPYQQNSLNQLGNINNNLNYLNNNFNMNSQQFINRNYSAITPKINYLNESNSKLNNQNINNNLNYSKQENLRKSNSSINKTDINRNEKENDFILISNDNDLNNKIQNEKKLEEWKNDLKLQVEEKRKRDEQAKKDQIMKEKEEKIKFQEYLEYKNRQAEEQNKKNKLKRKNYMNKSNILETNNELEQSNQTISDNQNKNNLIQNPYNQNNPLNDYNISPEILKEQENFKNYIDQQYESLGQSLGQNIHNEIMKMTSMLTNKYEPFSKNENYKNYSKFNNEPAVRNDKKMQKIQDIIEERELLDFIIGQKEIFSPFKYKNFDIDKYNRFNKENVSYFGINRISNERRFVNLDSESKFLYGDFSNNVKSKEYKSVFSNEEYEKEKNFNENNNIYDNKIRSFGKNKENIEVQESIGVSQSLDNKSSFIPINNVEEKDYSKINKNLNENIIKEDMVNRGEIKLHDKIEDNIIKNLKEINLLNKNVILYDIDNNLVRKNNLEYNENINNDEQKKIIEEQKNNIEQKNHEIKIEEKKFKRDIKNKPKINKDEVKPKQNEIKLEEINNNINTNQFIEEKKEDKNGQNEMQKEKTEIKNEENDIKDNKTSEIGVQSEYDQNINEFPNNLEKEDKIKENYEDKNKNLNEESEENEEYEEYEDSGENEEQK